MAAPWYLRASSHSTTRDERGRRALEVVVPHHVAEAVRLLELLARERDPLADLARALRRPVAEPALELGDVGGDEDRDAPGHLVLHLERALELELEDADLRPRRRSGRSPERSVP